MWEPQGIYSKFLLKQPTLLFGENAVRGLINFPASRIAIIHGKSLLNDQKEIIQKAIRAFEIKFISKSWNGEPILSELSGTIYELEEFKPDVIIAIGGGSVIDGTKIARLYYEFPFFNIQSPRFSYLEWKTKFLILPTTIGSGSEVSSSAVMLNTETKSKEMIVSHSFIPSVIILDPSFIKHSPLKIVYLSTIDALSHIIEGYVSIIENGLADIYAEKGLSIINEFVQSESEEFELADLNRIQLAGYFGGIVQNHCIVGAAHAIAHQLAGYEFSHAEAISLVLEEVIIANSKDDTIKSKYEQLAKRSGILGINGLFDLINKIKNRIGLVNQQNELKLIIPELINNCEFLENVKKDKGGKGNPITISNEYIIEILNKI